MPDLGQAIDSFVKAAKELKDAAVEEATADEDEQKKVEAMRAASTAVLRAKGTEATEAAGRKFHDAEKEWKAAKSRHEKAEKKTEGCPKEVCRSGR
jgi:hypothetical protein